MNELEVVSMDGKQTIDSRLVAESLKIQHKNLLQKVANYEDILAGSKFSPLEFFIPSTYLDAQKKTRKCYLLTKKGCEMVANKMTGEKGILFTAQYVEAFNKMEKQIEQRRIKSISRIMEQLYDNQMILRDRIQSLEGKMTVSSTEALELKKAVIDRVEVLLGTKHSPLYKEISNEVTTRLWSDYRRYFKIHSYKDTLSSRYKEAMSYINNWEPDYNLTLRMRQMIKNMKKNKTE